MIMLSLLQFAFGYRKNTWIFFIALLTLGTLLEIGETADEQCPGSKLTLDERQTILRVHNQLRSDVANGKVTGKSNTLMNKASNMHELVWDCDLEFSAQKWSTVCRFQHSDEKVGENIHTFYTERDGMFEEAMKNFWDEMQDRTTDLIHEGEYEDGKAIGHATQMAWAKTSRIGCGLSYRCSGDMSFLVCHYLRRGNFYGRNMYEAGEPCSRCDMYAGASCNSLGLCVGGGEACENKWTNCDDFKDDCGSSSIKEKCPLTCNTCSEVEGTTPGLSITTAEAPITTESVTYTSTAAGTMKPNEGKSTKDAHETPEPVTVSTTAPVIGKPGNDEEMPCPNSKLSDGMRSLALNTHNEYRTAIAYGNITAYNGFENGPASNMRKLKWSCILERTAQQWADECHYTAQDEGFGMVIMSVREKSREEALKSGLEQLWYDRLFVGSRVFNDTEFFFNQMIWSQTNELGCGVSTSCDGFFIVVCHYMPRGSIKGDNVYELGPPCSRCSDYGSSSCENNLCLGGDLPCRDIFGDARCKDHADMCEYDHIKFNCQVTCKTCSLKTTDI